MGRWGHGAAGWLAFALAGGVLMLSALLAEADLIFARGQS
ncbi:MAG: hypothetical protein ACJAW4_002862 [Paracoccaceae bacterium]|jgi:hypothetical protein